HDASEVTYYFDSYDNGDPGEAWSTNPSFMVDGDIEESFASTSIDDVELCDGNTYSSNNGTITKVELRAHGYYSEEPTVIKLRPVFSGISDGDNHEFEPPNEEPGWSNWFDITGDTNAPGSWIWSDIQNLDCDVETEIGEVESILYCAKVEIKVTYTVGSVPMISNPNPSYGATGVGITPMLSISVTDSDRDNMNITWYSNSSGSWIAFGTNISVPDGTYHQTFSNATVNGQWWYWKVNVTDGTDYNESSVFKFYTGHQSKIKNTGSTNIHGYLL
ncbi:unnamed protein product, partial [marine sediment metagenome]